jgi:ceramide glucosyltransferase
MVLFYFFAAIVIWLGILSVRDGIRHASFVRSESAKPLSNFTPFASIIAPCRGLDQGLRDNLSALFRQDYPAYEIIFVTDNADDPSSKLIREVEGSEATATRIPTRMIVAGDATDRGQKVHNLSVAVGEINPQSQVLVFVDTDARPSRRWLRWLVAPLSDAGIGAATGYRWFIPVRGGLASHLRSVWNASIASALGPNVNKNFCWGGSMAIRRDTFERLNIRKHWQGTVSDDFTVTRVLKTAGLPIQFVPQCLTPSLEDCTAGELFEFTTRQLKITRAYAAHLWRTVLVGGLLFNLVFFGGIVLVSIRIALGLPFIIPLLLLVLIFALGAAKAYLRMIAVGVPLAEYTKDLKRMFLAHLLLWPISSALYLLNALAAAFSRRIEWRGISYELKSPTEAVIIRRDFVNS